MILIMTIMRMMVMIILIMLIYNNFNQKYFIINTVLLLLSIIKK